MINKLEKLYNSKIIQGYFILFPIIEIGTSLMVEYTNIPVTIGVVYKLLFLLFSIIYLIGVDVTHRKSNLIILGVFFATIIAHFFITMDGYSTGAIFSKLSGIGKYATFPLAIAFLYRYSQNGNKISLKVMIYSATIYAFSMIVAKLTNTAQPTYSSFPEYGHSGWYFSGNEISSLMSMFYPITIYYASKTEHKKLLIALAIISYGLWTIGTKTSYVSMAVSMVIMLIYGIINYTVSKEKNSMRTAIVSAILIVCLIISSKFSPSLQFMIQRFESALDIASNSQQEEKQEVLIDNFVFNGRQIELNDQLEKYNSSNMLQKLFGLNDGVKSKDSSNNYNVVERDFYDILFTYGMVGVLIYFVPMVYLIGIFIKRTWGHFKKEIKAKEIAMSISIILGLAISYIAGHVLLAPTVALYLAYIFVMLAKPKAILET